MKILSIVPRVAFTMTCLLAAASVSFAVTVNPGDFNVYSLGDIGLPGDTYGADFQGVTGAGGGVYFGGFTLTGLNKVDGHVLFTGGPAVLNVGDFLGSIDVGGDVTLTSFSTAGNINTGGTIYANGGQITGSATAAGAINLNSGASVGGTTSPNTPYTPAMDLSAMNQYFLDTSAEIAGWSDTGVITNQYNGLSATVGSGVNVLSIDEDSLKNAWGFTLTGPADAIVYINVTGTNVELNWLDWTFTGGVGAEDVLLNYNQADTFLLENGGVTNILAPNADMTYSYGEWIGSLVVGSLQGDGQVNLGGFDHYSTPEPGTISLLTMGGIALLTRRKA